jgi:hypothetical protein
MECTGIKLSVIKLDGSITTWQDSPGKIEDIINRVKDKKKWVGGRFEWIYLIFSFEGKFYKIYVNHLLYNQYLK